MKKSVLQKDWVILCFARRNIVYAGPHDYNHEVDQADKNPDKKNQGGKQAETEVNIKLKLLLLEFPYLILLYHYARKT